MPKAANSQGSFFGDGGVDMKARDLVNLHKPISLPFLVVLVIVVFELSIADPGTAAGWTVLFASLGLSSDFVGLFLAFELLTANYNAAYGALQMGLEAIESAASFDAIDMDRVRQRA